MFYTRDLIDILKNELSHYLCVQGGPFVELDDIVSWLTIMAVKF